eukprot:784886-Prorocentrum_minimum.AAC.1
MHSHLQLGLQGKRLGLQLRSLYEHGQRTVSPSIGQEGSHVLRLWEYRGFKDTYSCTRSTVNRDVPEHGRVVRFEPAGIRSRASRALRASERDATLRFTRSP